MGRSQSESFSQIRGRYVTAGRLPRIIPETNSLIIVMKRAGATWRPSLRPICEWAIGRGGVGRLWRGCCARCRLLFRAGMPRHFTDE